MTIDERLEKLTERHEVLTQTVELLALRLEKTGAFVQEIAEGTARLLPIAEIHEQRINRLESGD